MGVAEAGRDGERAVADEAENQRPGHDGGPDQPPPPPPLQGQLPDDPGANPRVRANHQGQPGPGNGEDMPLIDNNQRNKYCSVLYKRHCALICESSAAT